MSQNSMTTFSRRLGAYLAGRLPLHELETAIDRVVADGDDIDGAAALLEMHRASGRLAMPLYRTLQRRLRSGRTTLRRQTRPTTH